MLGPWRTVVVLGMGGGGWNRSSLGLSCRTETPPQPHPIAASQEAREGLEVPFPVCVSTASQRLQFSYVSQRLTETIYISPRDVQRLRGAPPPTPNTEQLWGLFLTPSFCVVFWFISRKSPVAKKGPRPTTDLDNKRASPAWKVSFLCVTLCMKIEVWGWGTGSA